MLLWRYWLRLVCSDGEAVQLRRFARLVWLAFAPMVQAFRLAALLLGSCGVLAALCLSLLVKLRSGCRCCWLCGFVCGSVSAVFAVLLCVALCGVLRC